MPALAMIRPPRRLSLLVLVVAFGLVSVAGTAETKPKAKPPVNKNKQDAAGWISLFDGKTLAGWKPTKFAGRGDVWVEKGRLMIDFGMSMSGVTYQKDFPTSNYEIRFEAQRVEGTDFFVGLTFPVKKSHCSLIVGGWGGGVVGLSSIDGKDASENATSKVMAFKPKHWYPIRLRVTDDAITVWLAGKQIIDQKLAGKKISTRVEVDLSKPLGFSTWETRAALRKIEYRKLPPPK